MPEALEKKFTDHASHIGRRTPMSRALSCFPHLQSWLPSSLGPKYLPSATNPKNCGTAFKYRPYS